MQSGLLSGGFSEARAASCPPMTGVRAMPSSGRPRCNAIWHWRRLSGRSPSVTGDGRRRRGGLDPRQGVTGAIVGARNAAQVDACWALPNSSWMMRIWRASPMRSSGRARARGRRVRRRPVGLARRSVQLGLVDAGRAPDPVMCRIPAGFAATNAERRPGAASAALARRTQRADQHHAHQRQRELVAEAGVGVRPVMPCTLTGSTPGCIGASCAATWPWRRSRR